MKKLTTSEFIKKAKLIHGDKYDYSLVDYKKSNINIKIICLIHGDFEQSPTTHLSGSGCPICANVKQISFEEFKLKANKIYEGKYNYSLANYKNTKIKIKIICPIHGEFYQTPYNHLLKTTNNSGCRKCGIINRSKNKTLNTKIFIEKSKQIHHDKYDYSLVNYINAKTKVKIICYKHGIFQQTPDKHLAGQNCPICKISKGEQLIQKFLLLNNIKFIPQYKFNECKNKKQLPFDFYLPDHNICIEFQGEQHYKPFWKSSQKNSEEILNRVKINDQIKRQYCIKNNIQLIEITYKENIEIRLKNVFKI